MVVSRALPGLYRGFCQPYIGKSLSSFGLVFAKLTNVAGENVSLIKGCISSHPALRVAEIAADEEDVVFIEEEGKVAGQVKTLVHQSASKRDRSLSIDF